MDRLSGNQSLKSKSRFIDHVFKLVAGSAFAQGLGILLSPIMARLFAPETFGVAALFIAIAGVLGTVASLRYELSIMLPKSDQDAANLLAASLLIAVIISISVGGTIVLLGHSLAEILNAPELIDYLWLLPIAISINGAFVALSYWSSRLKQFGRLSIVRIYSSFFNNGTKLGLGYVGFVNAGVLIGAPIIGQLISTSILGAQIWRNDHELLKGSIRWKQMGTELRKHRKFPIFSTFTALSNSLSVQAPTWILAFFFSPGVVGFYALGKTALSMPIQLVGNAVAQVFFQRAAEAKGHSGDLSKTIENLFRRLVSLGLFPIVMLTMIGEEVFVFVFGPKWAEAGVYMQILSPWLFIVFISSPFSNLFNILGKQESALVFDLILLAVRVLSLIYGGLIGDVHIALMLFSGSSTVVWTCICFWLLGISGASKTKALLVFAKCFFYCMPTVGIVGFANWGLHIDFLGLFAMSCLGALLYYGLIISEDKDLKKYLLSLLSRRDIRPAR
jgi:lipopolysaccharide exporter